MYTFELETKVANFKSAPTAEKAEILTVELLLAILKKLEALDSKTSDISGKIR